MKNVIAYVHLLGCIGWTIFIVIMLIITREESTSAGDVLAVVTMLLTTLSGIYLFAVGRSRSSSRLQQLKVENAILEREIQQKELKRRLGEAGEGEAVRKSSEAMSP